jgi:hypothetical protein
MADILDRVLERLQALAPDVPRPALTALEAQLRAELGGCEAGYIAKRQTLQRQHALGQALAQGQTPAQAFATAGVARRTGFRLMARPLQRR